MVEVNWLAILLAALVNMVIGYAWYSDFLFGKQWRKLSGINPGKGAKEEMNKMITIGSICALLTAFVLSHNVIFAGSYLGTSGFSLGAMTGFWNFIGLMFPVLISGFLYEKKPLKLVFINSGYWLTAVVAMGVILAVWK